MARSIPKPFTKPNNKKKFLIQVGFSKDIVTQEAPWLVVEGESAEEVAERHLLDPQYSGEWVIRVLPYEPLVFARGVKRLNPPVGCSIGARGGL